MYDVDFMLLLFFDDMMFILCTRADVVLPGYDKAER